MRAVVQRVRRAAVWVDEEQVGSIGHGFLVLLGVGREDTENDAVQLAERICKLRLFPDAVTGEPGFRLGLNDVGGEVLVVSQFTLYADTRRGRRPSFTDAAPAEQGRLLYEKFVESVRSLLGKVETGRFGANMQVELINDGPVTITLSTEEKK